MIAWRFVARRCGTLAKSARHTIFAHSSGQGRCGVAVIRISGPEAGHVLKRVTGADRFPKARHAALKRIVDPRSGEPIDRGLVLWFPAPHSFTGEDCCELQVHGSVAVVRAILDALGRLPRVRLAEAGEFTKRAYANGKLDLTAVEGLADLLHASTEAQRKQAYRQSEGALRRVYERWRERLVAALAHLECYIDFHETDDVDLPLDAVTAAVAALRDEVHAHLRRGERGERLRCGVRASIVGATNVGKSSLLNALCRRPAAIVTPVAGTTRDVLEVALDVGGYPLIVADTAGLRADDDARDVVEREGMRRALRYAADADLILLVADSVAYAEYARRNATGDAFEAYLRAYIDELGLDGLVDSRGRFRKRCVAIMNKIDCVDDGDVAERTTQENGAVHVSCKTEAGFERLLARIEAELGELCGDPSREDPCMNQARHKQHLDECLRQLDAFLAKDDDGDTAIRAEYLRKAVAALGGLTGKVTTEEILDIIFREFCIGK